MALSPSPPSLRAGKWLGAGGGSSLEEVGSEKGKGPPRRLPSSLLSGAWESRGGNAQRSSPKGFLAPAGAIVPWRNLLQEARPAVKSVQLSLSPAGELSPGRSCSGGICFVCSLGFVLLRAPGGGGPRRAPSRHPVWPQLALQAVKLGTQNPAIAVSPVTATGPQAAVQGGARGRGSAPASPPSPAPTEPRNPAASSQPFPGTSELCWGLAVRGDRRSKEVLSLAQARWKPATFPALEMPCERRKTCCFCALMLCEGKIPALLPQERKTFLVPLLSS